MIDVLLRFAHHFAALSFTRQVVVVAMLLVGAGLVVTGVRVVLGSAQTIRTGVRRSRRPAAAALGLAVGLLVPVGLGTAIILTIGWRRVAASVRALVEPLLP